MPLLQYWNIKDSDILPEIEKKNSPIIKEILDLLRFSGKVPNFTVDKNLPFGVSGEYNTRNDTIGFNPWSGNRPSTMTHELTHALSNRMAIDSFRWRNSNNQVSPEKLQFIDALQKLKNPSFKGTNDPYRDSTEEQWGFGTGAYSGVPPESWESYFNNSGTLHQDATNATEQAVLRDLYRRALQSGRSK